MLGNPWEMQLCSAVATKTLELAAVAPGKAAVC